MKRQFINQDNVIDKEGLRQYGLTQLSGHLKTIDLLFSTNQTDFWKKLHDAIGAVHDADKQHLLREVEAQLVGLREFIAAYIQSALDSPERFELFVETKAAEINSGNDAHNYFWALQIRRDQILSVVTVITSIIEQLQTWVTLPISELLDDLAFLNLGTVTIEKQIYLEAEKHYFQRTK